MTWSLNPTHLFISYASEDAYFAGWLARKLASAGYAVWFDQIKLLGGEPWPQSIDDAIKNRTFRMLGLISKHSLQKQKPTGERVLAQRIGEQRQVPDFLIPLKIDGSELDWMTTNVTYIQFANGWADGWRSLIKKLDAIHTPRTLEAGSRLAASSFPRGEDLINVSGEQLFSNLIRVESFPKILPVYRLVGILGIGEMDLIDQSWSYYKLAPDALVALVPPPSQFEGRIKPTDELVPWTESDTYRMVRSRDIAATLITKSIGRKLLKAGCLEHPNPNLKGTFYLPQEFTPSGKLIYKGYRGRSTWLQIRGKVTFRHGNGLRELNYHHFGFRLRLARGLDQYFYLQLTPTLVFFDHNNHPVIDKSVGSRRRRLTKMWYNGKWLSRILAASEILLALPSDGKGDLVLEPGLLKLNCPTRLAEDNLYDVESEEDVDLHAAELDLGEGGDDRHDE